MKEHTSRYFRVAACVCATIGLSTTLLPATGVATMPGDDPAPSSGSVVATTERTMMAGSSGPTTWVQSSYDDFRAGELTAVSLDNSGDVRLAPQLTPVGDAREAFVWALDGSADGGVFVSAGTEGKVYRFADSSSTEAELFFEASGTAHAMKLGPDEHLYVAASSSGEVFRVPLGGEAPRSEQPWFSTDARYIWALAFGPDGSLYVGTGDGGVIHRVAPDGTGEVLYDSKETHITALAVDARGDVLAGSSDSGHLYRISPEGDVFVLFDAPMKQITGIVPSEYGVFFSGLEQNAGEASGGNGESDEPAVAGSNGDSLRGAVYLLRDDGLVEQLWGSGDDSPHALAPSDSGVVVGTGGDGRMIGVGPGPTIAILGDTDATQVTALRKLGDELLVGTSNLGRVYRLGNTHRARGELVLQVKDTTTTSRWGRVRWRGQTPEGTSIRIFVRAGNTADPDETWSDWAGPYDDAGGSRIDSPPARFVQWKAELTTDGPQRTPVLQWVELVYVQRNLRPEIEDFILHPPGVIYRQTTSFEDALPIGRLPSPVREALAAQRGREASSSSAGSGFLGQAYYLPGSQTFTWDASDANGDQMTYSLWYRGEAEGMWKPVATGLSETRYLWDTTTVPDGLYRARLTASDAPSNPAGQELEGNERSEPFVIDNTAPRIDNLSADNESGAIRVTGDATDETSLIRAMEYAIDGGEWHTVVPADGMPDAGSEQIGFVTPTMEPGEHTIVVRVTDNALNGGTEKVVVTVQ